MRKIREHIAKLLPWLKKRTLSSASIETEQEHFKSSEQILPLDTPSQLTFLHTVRSIKYSTFLDIILGGPVTLLGKGEETDLYLTWQQILQDYSELIETPKSKNIFELWLKVTSTQNKIFLLQVVLKYLRIGYDEEMASIVAESGYGFVEPLEDRRLYLNQIEEVEQESKVLVVLFNQYANEYNLLCPEDKSKPKIDRTRMDYEKELAVLSKHNGFRLRAEDITIFEFCTYVNTYIETMKHGTTF